MCGEDSKLPMASSSNNFARMLLQLVARNQDPSTWRTSPFLRNKGGAWSLSPALRCDVRVQPTGVWTRAIPEDHSNGKAERIHPGGFPRASSRRASKLHAMREILGGGPRSSATVENWRRYASEARCLRSKQRAHRPYVEAELGTGGARRMN